MPEAPCYINAVHTLHPRWEHWLDCNTHFHPHKSTAAQKAPLAAAAEKGRPVSSFAAEQKCEIAPVSGADYRASPSHGRRPQSSDRAHKNSLHAVLFGRKHGFCVQKGSIYRYCADLFPSGCRFRFHEMNRSHLRGQHKPLHQEGSLTSPSQSAGKEGGN